MKGLRRPSVTGGVVDQVQRSLLELSALEQRLHVRRGGVVALESGLEHVLRRGVLLRILSALLLLALGAASGVQGSEEVVELSHVQQQELVHVRQTWLRCLCWSFGDPRGSVAAAVKCSSLDVVPVIRKGSVCYSSKVSCNKNISDNKNKARTHLALQYTYISWPLLDMVDSLAL